MIKEIKQLIRDGMDFCMFVFDAINMYFDETDEEANISELIKSKNIIINNIDEIHDIYELIDIKNINILDGDEVEYIE